MAMTRPDITVFDLAQVCLHVHAGRDYRAHVDFIDDAGRRQAVFANNPVLAMALDLLADILDETLNDGFGHHDLEALLDEASGGRASRRHLIACGNGSSGCSIRLDLRPGISQRSPDETLSDGSATMLLEALLNETRRSACQRIARNCVHGTLWSLRMGAQK